MSEQMMFAVLQSESVMDISINKLVVNKKTPFKLYNGNRLNTLIESIRINGILNPLIVRELKSKYEILSGANRFHVAQIIGLKTVPIVNRTLDDVSAMQTIINSNIQRERLLPSEKAKSYHLQTKLCPTDTISSLIAKNNTSKKQWYRFLRLNELIPCLLNTVDKGKLPFRSAVELSYLPHDKQQMIYRKVAKGLKITLQQAALLREQGETLTIESVNKILIEKPDKKIIISYSEIADYLSDNCKAKEEIIQTLKWRFEYDKQRHL